MSLLSNLECDTVAPIKTNINPFKISAPKQINSAEEAEKELFSFNPDFWIASHLKKRGRSLKDIYDHFKGRYTQVEIGYMLDKVITVNTFMANRDADLLRQQMLDELDDLEKIIWDYEKTGDLNEKHVKTLLQIKDRKILLLGLNAPEKVEIDINHSVADATEKLMNSYDRYMKMRQNSIDVTPKIDASAPDLTVPQEIESAQNGD